MQEDTLSGRSTPALDHYTAKVMDNLLAHVRTLSQGPFNDDIRDVRIEIRRRQPDIRFTFSAASEQKVERLAAETRDSEIADGLSDVLALFRSQVSALDVTRKWHLATSTPFDAEIDLSPFWSPSTYDENATKFKHQIHDAAPLEILIRGHLWIEVALVRLLEFALPSPIHLANARLTFSQKVSLAAAMGLLEDDVLTVIRLVNKIRNRMAHSFDEDVTQSDQADLQGALGNRLRAAGQLQEKATSFPAGITQALTITAAAIHVRLDTFIVRRRYEDFVASELRRVLDET